MASRVATALPLLTGTAALAAGWAGPRALGALAAAALVPYLMLATLGARHRLPAPLAAVLVLLPVALAVTAAVVTTGTDPVHTVRDAVPRLLTAARPAPPTPELLLPGVLLAALVGAWVGTRAARPGGGRFASVAGAAALYVAGALLTAGRADPHGVLAIAVVASAVAVWLVHDRGVTPAAHDRGPSATPYDRGPSPATHGRGLTPVAHGSGGPAGGAARDRAVPVREVARAAPAAAVAAAAAALLAAATPVAGAFEPRHLVPPPALPVVERNPLPRLAAFADRADTELLRYRGAEARLRLVALGTFNGATWQAGGRYRPVGAVAEPGALPPGPRRADITLEVTIAALDGLWLPSPGDPAVVSLPEARVDAETGSLAFPPGLQQGLRYQIRGHGYPPVDDELAVAAVPAGTRYVDVPRLPYAFAEYAQRIVRGAGTPFEQAVLIETAVRQGRRVNDTAPVGSSYARLATFLFGAPGATGAQAGTSEQFATSFAVLARAVGLPTRVMIGFRPGDPGPDAVRIVRGRHALAWPEVYFGGRGWVAFDPTPSTQDISGRADEVTRQLLDRVERNQPPAGAPPRPVTPAQTVSAAPLPGGPAAAAPRAARFPVRWAGIVPAGLVALLVAGRAVRRLRHRRAGPRGAWSEVLDLLVLLDHRPPRWHSAARIALDIATRLPAAEPHPARRLAEHADRATFAPRGSTVASPWADLRRLRRVARRAVPWYRRVLWPVDPRPLLRR